MKSLLPWICCVGPAFVLSTQAAIHTEPVEYIHGNAVLQGFLAHDPSVKGKRPGVLVVHQWKGLGDYEKKRAEMLAQLGYNVLAVDIYGKGIRADNPQDASELAGKYQSDRTLLRARTNAGLDVLRNHALTDSRRIAAIGYCFGGTAVLELARSGADISGVVSFHGALDTPNPDEAKSIRCKILALHGADDPFVTHKDVAAFEEEMRRARVDWQLTSYGGAVHSFTHWNAGHDNSKGAAYNEKADRRSWESMKLFFGEIFQSAMPPPASGRNPGN